MKMKNIEVREEVGTKGTHTGKWCIFKMMIWEFYGLDYSDDAVILLNGIGKFIIGKKYPNCISIGSGIVREYSTIEEAMQVIDNGSYDRYIK